MMRKIGKDYYGIVKSVTIDNEQLRQAVAEAFLYAKSLPVEKIRSDVSAANPKVKTAGTET